MRGKAKRMGCSFRPASSDCIAWSVLDSGPDSLNLCTHIDWVVTTQQVLGLHSPRPMDREGGRTVLDHEPVLGSGPASVSYWLARSTSFLFSGHQFHACLPGGTRSLPSCVVWGNTPGCYSDSPGQQEGWRGVWVVIWSTK